MQPKEEDEEKPRVMPSLSVYSQSQVQSFLRPFSAVFDKNNPDAMKSEQLQEIEEVKNRMAKYKINVPIKRLMDSILIPEGLAGDKKN